MTTLTPADVAAIREEAETDCVIGLDDALRLCDSHERLRADRDRLATALTKCKAIAWQDGLTARTRIGSIAEAALTHVEDRP